VSEVVTVGSTKTWELIAKKDGVVWDISSAVVTLYFVKQDSSIVSFNAPVTDGINGIAKYTNLSTLFVSADRGTWFSVWKVADGSVVEYSVGEVFTVADPFLRPPA